MFRTLFIFLLFTLIPLWHQMPALQAQTVIDLHTGLISAKTKDDYDVKAREQWQQEQDSLAYVDCLTRAFNYLHADSLALAQEHFERALALRPDAPGNRVVQHNLARILMARSQWKDALQRLSRLVQKDPTWDEAREDRAACCLQLSLFEQALEDYDNLLLRHPADAHFLLLRAMARCGAGKPYEALDDLDEAIRNDANHADAYLLRAEIHLDLGQRGYARRDVENAAKLGAPQADLAHLMQRLSDD